MSGPYVLHASPDGTMQRIVAPGPDGTLVLVMAMSSQEPARSICDLLNAAWREGRATAAKVCNGLAEEWDKEAKRRFMFDRFDTWGQCQERLAAQLKTLIKEVP